MPTNISIASIASTTPIMRIIGVCKSVNSSPIIAVVEAAKFGGMVIMDNIRREERAIISS